MFRHFFNLCNSSKPGFFKLVDFPDYKTLGCLLILIMKEELKYGDITRLIIEGAMEVHKIAKWISGSDISKPWNGTC